MSCPLIQFSYASLTTYSKNIKTIINWYLILKPLTHWLSLLTLPNSIFLYNFTTFAPIHFIVFFFVPHALTIYLQNLETDINNLQQNVDTKMLQINSRHRKQTSTDKAIRKYYLPLQVSETVNFFHNHSVHTQAHLHQTSPGIITKWTYDKEIPKKT